jgi:hypothetical protein
MPAPDESAQVLDDGADPRIEGLGGNGFGAELVEA